MIGDGDWTRFEDEPHVPGVVYVRLGDGGFSEMYVKMTDRPIKASDLRRLPLAQMYAMTASRWDIRLMLADYPDVQVPPEIDGVLEVAFPAGPKGQADVDSTAVLKPPSNGLTSDFLRQVAAAYQAALARGERPLKSLAEQVGGKLPEGAPASAHPHRRIVERWVYLSRKAGHLPPTTRGSVS